MKKLLLGLLLAGTCHAQSMFNGKWTDPVLLYFKDSKGWHVRVSKVEHISHSQVGVCYQQSDKPSLKVKCWFSDGDLVVLLDVPLVGEEIT
jgi:hypothetical protein